MLTVFFYCEDVIHYEFLFMAERWTRNIIWRWWKDWESKWGEKGLIWSWEKVVASSWQCSDTFSLLIRDFLTKHCTSLIPQPPYSPDLAPVDFFLFTKLKSVLKGWWFESIEEIKKICWQSYALFQKRHSRNARSDV